MEPLFTNEELAIKLGKDIKSLRLLRNIDRQTLCTRAGISLNALRHLEGGAGASIKTLIAILQSLAKTDWLLALAPQVTVNPLHLPLYATERKRARSVSKKVRGDLAHKEALLKKYGLTIDEFVKMHKYQGGKCGNPGCQNELDLKESSTHVDHNHATGKVRSLMCSGCNTALGLLKENSARAAGLVDYLKTHNGAS